MRNFGTRRDRSRTTQLAPTSGRMAYGPRRESAEHGQHLGGTAAILSPPTRVSPSVHKCSAGAAEREKVQSKLRTYKRRCRFCPLIASRNSHDQRDRSCLTTGTDRFVSQNTAIPRARRVQTFLTASGAPTGQLWSAASWASCSRDVSPSLASMWVRCVCTVRGAMKPSVLTTSSNGTNGRTIGRGHDKTHATSKDGRVRRRCGVSTWACSDLSTRRLASTGTANNEAMAHLSYWCHLAKGIAGRSSRWRLNWPMNSRY